MTDEAPAQPKAGGLSFRTKLMAGVCALVVATGGIVAWLSHRNASRTSRALGESVFREVSGRAATHTRAHVLAAAPVVEVMRNLAGQTLALDESDRLARQLIDIIRANPTLSWVYYGDEKGTFTGAFRLPDGKLRVNQSHIDSGHTK